MKQPKKRVVVALGGNAILTKDASAQAQQATLIETSKQLVKLIKQGVQLIISHGNGPQVGNLLLQQQADNSKENPAMPLDTCVAMTQGSIGYWLQNALKEELNRNKLEKDVVTLITQIMVDQNDQAFKNPSKPIGPFLTYEQAQKQMKETGTIYKEDAGRGWRKVVPSPQPISIKEYHSIDTLVNNDIITICAGGGGIPIEKQTGKGIEAVIDKDLASEKLAELIKADVFIILTDVEKVALNFGKKNVKWLDKVTIEEMEQYKKEGQFATGSMLPKVEAAIAYVKAYPMCRAIITSLDKLEEINENNISVGTEIVYSADYL
ncbi:carbamate kinase [Melissococcus plutonius]|uniref:Carbamate kinase n=2 Tax=Melissococcus plutonius TaxID=33970 RepID=F3YAL9_MELPT|nr:carbamate kinase [Melissococcus plutonius]BAL62094.1 carbamate kinase [Melissococcus plutonius DAT561]AIM25738.1 carbamate kinase 1 [Melissococcus plutonius S1]KMT25172.1 carbamate kinase 1 [Melissococcus plutonius]KMT26078.1 carbamate kinase 1 [Melissococcus plutonius]KMT26808.1 carbamate kinase 1 [Melissococcus plutonius]